jgi:glycerol uptake facilitator protein
LCQSNGPSSPAPPLPPPPVRYNPEDVTVWHALLVEAFGTFVLCFVIFALTHTRSHVTASAGVTVPVLIGGTVALLLTL